MSQMITNQINTYLIRLQGSLRASAINWCGNVTITPQNHGAALRISLTIEADSLCSFLNQFQHFSLSILPDEYVENTLQFTGMNEFHPTDVKEKSNAN